MIATLAGCSPATAPRHLDPALPWYGDNRERIDAFLDENADVDAPVAVFDWDNTVIKNDDGDMMFYWMIANDKVLQPPGRLWFETSPYMTAAGAAALGQACDDAAEPGQPLPTSKPENLACADELLAGYDGTTTTGEAVFADWNHRTMEPTYAWIVQLQAGYTPAEIRGFADAAIDAALAAEPGAVQTVGSQTDLNAYIRIYDQIHDLIGTLQADGFDVWVLSASSQPVVEAFAARVSIDADHVVGLRTVVGDDGKLTSELQGCGGAERITYIEGKRCWMNQEIFGVTGADAAAIQTDTTRRPAFAAGDSDTDVAFLQDSTGLKLVLNRNKKQLMCNAYNDAGGNWLINPMFIEPKDQLTDGYACSVDACTNEAGDGVPCTDERGDAIPDQEDAVFCTDAGSCG